MAAGRSGRATLVLLAAVCTLPVIASYVAYYLWRPADRVNYGELIPLTPMPAQLAAAVPEIRGRWTLVYATRGACDAACEQALYYMRQVRTAQGEHMERVERLWLRAGDMPPRSGLLDGHEGLIVAEVDGALMARLPGLDHVLLLDPLGNLMMKFPADPDPKKMIRDLARLLKYSRSG
ncbi:MAG: hypothetical protein KDH15_15145 [Rhodocyclaceae bacterium]|nr:hypothetical protein [Rhodocyclaceae bacterium]